MAGLFTLNAAAQTMPDHMPQQGRRGTFRPGWALRRAAAGGQDLGPGGNYFHGEKHQLVVLASFADNPFLGDETATLAQWDKILNTRNLSEAPFAGSFHDYFYDQSYGQFSLVCDLQFVKVDSCRRYRSTYTDDENSQYLMQDVIDTLKWRNIEWSRYDWNGDGYVNQLLIIFAGQGSKYGGMGPSTDAIWPHQWWLSQHLKDRQQGVYCSPDTVRYQNKDYVLDSYCAVQELSSDSTYGTFGTLCHEFTHCFGFPDFYYSGYNKTPYLWELMDAGNYNEGGFRPVGYSAHERWLMGWLTPTELTTQTTVTGMPALADQPTAYIIRNDGYPDEFYMVENRQKKGWDTSLPGSGLLIFHIDYVQSIWVSGPGNSPNEQHYMIIPASNQTDKYSCAGWAYPYGTNNALTDTSVPAATLWHANTAGTQLMSQPITGIAIQDGLASFSFKSVPTGMETVRQDPITDSRKLLWNGRILIQRGDKLYTMQGQEVIINTIHAPEK